MVCEYLGYPQNDCKRASDKKSAIAVLERWLGATEKEGKPKTWSMLLEILSNIEGLSTSTVVIEICDSLRSRGVDISEFLYILLLCVLE